MDVIKEEKRSGGGRKVETNERKTKNKNKTQQKEEDERGHKKEGIIKRR